VIAPEAAVMAALDGVVLEDARLGAAPPAPSGERGGVRLLALEWRAGAGSPERAEVVVTRRRRTCDGARGLLGCHFRLLAADGAVAREGTAVAEVPVRASAPDPDPAVLTDFCAPAWSQLLREGLGEDPRFQEATGTFDGTIGLRCGDDATQLRIYKGTILEAARSTPEGPTFTLAGSELAWAQLALADRNDFLARTSLGHFSTSGNAYAYLRMTKALVSIFDVARELAGPERAAA
jgi:hypothetical protein